LALDFNNIHEDNWHHLDIEQVIEDLATAKNGLSVEEAQNRVSKFGKNKLPDKQKISILKIVLHQLLNPLIFILVAAAFASILIGEGKDAVFIFLVILINSVMGTYQEYHAEKSASSLQKLMKIMAQVRRDGKKIAVSSEQLVPGDLIYIESGAKVPADIRLLDASNLEIDESFLTGESVASRKEIGVLAKESVVAERSNMAFAGSTVLKGRGIGFVVATGLQTQVGKISKNVTHSESAKPPLVQRMERFIKQISVVIVLLSVLLAMLLRWQDMDYSSIFFFVVALAVSAIPEGLPVALTVALSIATKRMARRNVIVRKLTSVESLGSCTIIASDKTGTLTVNEQTAQKIILPNASHFEIQGVGYNGDGAIHDQDGNALVKGNNPNLDLLAEIAALANEGKLKKNEDAWQYLGDSMDVALLGMVYKYGLTPQILLEKHELLGAIPYESENKFSAAIYRNETGVYMATKGAVETILDFCDSAFVNGENVALDKSSILKTADELAKKGYRVLAFARGTYDGDLEKKNCAIEDVPQSVFCGLVGFIDPLRPEAVESVAQCHKAGIKVLMITGDHPETAGTIARELGIADEKTKVVTGAMLTKSGSSDSKDFVDLVASTTVFARVSPTQKLEIVDVLIRAGEFVAVTGDGVNDAPALKRANIGVAMGSGTDVAKEVGAMIVVDDNFSSIIAGVEEGRYAYNNVRKVIYLLVSTGAGEIVLFLASIFMGLPLPLLAVQLLWLNLVTNGFQHVALAFESGEPGAMLEPPRRTTESIFDDMMIKQLLVSAFTMGGIVFGYWYYLNNFTDYTEYYARDLILLLMVFLQNFHVFNCRSERVSAFKVPISKNYMLVFGVLGAQGIHIISMHIPFMQNILRIEPITWSEWFSVLILAIPMIVVMEIFKFFNRKRN
jgi:magnesium-transporting ATPase (P-type)